MDVSELAVQENTSYTARMTEPFTSYTSAIYDISRNSKYKDSYYFTPSKMQMYFEYHDGEPPEFTLSEEVQANINKYSISDDDLGDELGDKMFYLVYVGRRK